MEPLSMAIAGRRHYNETQQTPVIDYEGSQYKTDFWVGQSRTYEDATERLALKRLLPTHGGRIAEIGAGFGRLADLYLGYEQIILFDYSRTLLQEAVQSWGHDARFVFVAGNIYQLPLADRILDSLVMIRVMHHLADVSQALSQLQRVLHRHSVAVIEYANKRNLKALLRWLARRQSWSPFDPLPLEFTTLNFNFHPQWMAGRFRDARFEVQQQFAISHFRLTFLKKRIAAKTLAQIDSLFFDAGGRFPLSPSVVIQAKAYAAGSRSTAGGAPATIGQLFRCPHCTAEPLELVAARQLLCTNCGRQYAQKQDIWDFKETIN
jgi:ubiquinone/menaquinone biosynthesis C-methylase UbiE